MFNSLFSLNIPHEEHFSQKEYLTFKEISIAPLILEYNFQPAKQ